MCPQTSRHRIFPARTLYHLPVALIRQNFVVDICKRLGIYSQRKCKCVWKGKIGK